MDTLMTIVGSVAGAAAAGFAYLRTRKGQDQALGYFKRLFNVDPTADDLRNAIDNLSSVVDTQGLSIEWLTTQLTQYREELVVANEKLKDMESIHKENSNLRSRITELEAQVKALEEELARRKKYTPKEKR